MVMRLTWKSSVDHPLSSVLSAGWSAIAMLVEGVDGELENGQQLRAYMQLLKTQNSSETLST
jgi:hypothetical protein